MALPNPPHWPLRFLRWFCKEESIDEIEGDLHEMFLKRSHVSVFKARCFFYWNVLRSCRRVNMKSFQWPMWTISFSQTLRYLRRDGIYSWLNALSLSIGFVLTILFARYAEEELSFDQFHLKSDRIYRVSFDQYMELGPYASTSYPIGPAIKKDFPEVKAMSRLGGIGRMPVRFEDKAFFETINLADEDFFEIFDFPLLHGDPKTVLKSHNQVVISESLAKKYFPDENPIGKELVLGSGGQYDSRVMGVFQDTPANSHIDVDMILSYATLYHHYSWMETLWQQMPRNYTYVLLNDEKEAAGLQDKLDQVKKRYVTDLERGGYDLRLIPLKDVHFYEGLINENTTNKEFQSLVTFGLVVALIMFIGVINFANMTSSRYLTRFKEVGVRKVLGAGKSQLLWQLLFQSFVMTVFSMFIAILLVVVTLPFFNELATKNFQLIDFLEPVSFLTITVLMIVIPIIAGIIPAIKLASMDVSRQSQSGQNHGRTRMGPQSYFLVFQYLATFFLMVSSLVMYEQLSFLDSKVDRGQEERIVVPINTRLSNDISVLGEELESHPSIMSTGASSHVPSFYGDSWPVRRSLEGTPVQTENFVITDDYPEVMSYRLLAGRTLNSALQSDREAGFVLNETCVKMLGFTTYEEAIGQTIFFGSDEPKKGKIVGITEDFHFESFQEKISPALFQFKPYDWMNYNFLVVKVANTEVLNAVDVIETEMGKIDPNWVVDASFFEDHFKRRYLQESNQGKLSTSLTFVAILLTCLGQIGLILHYVLSRQKEMAVRKVLGATVRQIWSLITGSYVLLMGIAIILAIPISLFFISEWLNGFYYRITLGPQPFIIATVTASLLVISVITIIGWNAARRNPVESLSEE